MLLEKGNTGADRLLLLLRKLLPPGLELVGVLDLPKRSCSYPTSCMLTWAPYQVNQISARHDRAEPDCAAVYHLEEV
jgi:hypothetical protein